MYFTSVLKSKMIGELINLSTLLLGLATKVPQIYDICKAGKADGIAPTGVAMEIWGFATFIMYTVGSEFPKWMYYEAAIILSQNTILLFLVLHYQRSLNARSIGIYMACALFQVGIALKYFPSFIITFVMNGNLLLMVIAMSTQLRMIIRNKDAGSLSLVSYIIAVYIMSGN